MTYSFDNSGDTLALYWDGVELSDSPIDHDGGVTHNAVGVITSPQEAVDAIEQDILNTGTPGRIEKQYSLVSEGVIEQS